ncbi:MAG: hypothetical protein RLZZ175_2744 [Bacteroidota bacterium]|jgi:hypothetical protein
MYYKIDKNKGRGYELTLTISSKKPIKLLVIGKDKHSDLVFFQRKYNGKLDTGFVGTEKLKFKLPLKPNNLKVYCINALNGSSESITINKIEHSFLKKTEYYQNQPSHIREFIDFAEWFAHNAIHCLVLK